MIKDQSLFYPVIGYNNSKKDAFIISSKNIYFEPKLNPDYNFDNFVEARCNMFARSAGIITGNNQLLSEFNPLIICGEAGVGKTHLALAVGNLVKEKFPEKNVLYVNAKKFLSKLSASLRSKEDPDFLSFYRMIDVLILDDIHEFARKERLQDSLLEFFYKPINQGKQFILTNKLPDELRDFEKRFLLLFKRGLRVTLLKPDYDAKLNILSKKAFENQIKLTDEILEYIVNNVSGDVREMESVLMSIYAHSHLHRKKITLDHVNRIIEKLSGTSTHEITIEYIQSNICDYYNIPVDKLFGRLRTKEIVEARQVSMFFSKRLTKASFESIGVRTGGRNHATVIHACKAVYKQIKENIQFSNQIKDLEKKIKYSII